jgi:hypothetical protein
MDVRQIAETYTQLGRLGRSLVGQPDAGNEQSRDAAEQEQYQPTLFIPVPARPAAEPACLNAAQARQLCEETAHRIEQTDQLEAGLRIHDISQIRLITPRYV